MLLLHLGMAATLHMADGQAGELYEQAVRVAREVGDEWLVSVALNQQGILACVQGDLSLATTVHEEALALMRETGDTAMVSYILRYLGRVPQQQGDYQRAGEVFRESLRLSDEAGFRFITLECRH